MVVVGCAVRQAKPVAVAHAKTYKQTPKTVESAVCAALRARPVVRANASTPNPTMQTAELAGHFVHEDWFVVVALV